MNLTIRKYDPVNPTRVHIDEGGCIVSSNTYSVRVFADDFKSDTTTKGYLSLLRKESEESDELTEYARCVIVADPYRRDCRVGTLVVNDAAHAELWAAVAPESKRNIDDGFILEATLQSGAARVIYAQVPVLVAPAEGE